MGTDLEKSSVCRAQRSQRGERRADIPCLRAVTHRQAVRHLNPYRDLSPSPNLGVLSVLARGHPGALINHEWARIWRRVQRGRLTTKGSKGEGETTDFTDPASPKSYDRRRWARMALNPDRDRDLSPIIPPPSRDLPLHRPTPKSKHS